MEEDGSNSIRRMSSRTRKAALARLDALENDNAGFEVADPNNDDDEASLDDEDGYMQKKQSKGTKRKTRQAKALEARKAPRTFLELLHENHCLHMFPPIGKQQLDLQAQPPGATTVPFVVFLPITLVSDVVCAFVAIDVKMCTMIPGA
ncbi:hypothetical protein SESBI_45307 [Sesbania bispinosa]|nr:hypothetical protein SESBI_45307 [Sesbania bispinosa]